MRLGQQGVGLVELVRGLVRGHGVHPQLHVVRVPGQLVGIDLRGGVALAGIGQDARAEGLVFGLVGLGFGKEAIHGCQRFGVFVVAVLDHRQVVHGVEVAVVVEAVGIDGLAEVVGGLALVVEVGGGIASQRERERLLVGAGGRHRGDLLGLGHHAGVVLLLEQLLQRLQLLDHLAAGLCIRGDAGRVRILRRLLLGLLGLFLALAELGHALGTLFAHRGGGRLLLGLRGRGHGQETQRGGEGDGERMAGMAGHGAPRDEDRPPLAARGRTLAESAAFEPCRNDARSAR